MSKVKKKVLKKVAISYLDPKINVNLFYAPYLLKSHIFFFSSWTTFLFSWNALSHNYVTDILWILHFLRSGMKECPLPSFSNSVIAFYVQMHFPLDFDDLIYCLVSTMIRFILILALDYLLLLRGCYWHVFL